MGCWSVVSMSYGDDNVKLLWQIGDGCNSWVGVMAFNKNQWQWTPMACVGDSEIAMQRKVQRDQ